jgi:hypothetical protein
MSRGISKFNPVFAGLTRYDSKFASLSKFNPEARKLFYSGFSIILLDFDIFFSFFVLQPN